MSLTSTHITKDDSYDFYLVLHWSEAVALCVDSDADLDDAFCFYFIFTVSSL